MSEPYDRFDAGLDAGFKGDLDPGDNLDFSQGHAMGTQIREDSERKSSAPSAFSLFRLFLWLVGLVVSFIFGGNIVEGPMDGAGLYIAATVLVMLIVSGVQSFRKRG